MCIKTSRNCNESFKKSNGELGLKSSIYEGNYLKIY